MIGTGTRLAAVIGAPVAHSRSPAMHNAAFAALGIDAVLLAFHVEPGDLAAAVSGLRTLGALGASVTVPHKTRVAALCDRLVPPADAIGAVNCLVFEPRGDGARVVGHNTDAGGFVAALREARGVEPADSHAVLLGAGGAARAVHAGLSAAGARVDVVARSPDAVTWTSAHPWTREALAALCARCDILVDCTSIGLRAEAERAVPAPIPIEALAGRALVATLVYHRRTALIHAAQARGLATMDGSEMLIHQGIEAFALWTGRRPPADVMRAALFSR